MNEKERRDAREITQIEIHNLLNKYTPTECWGILEGVKLKIFIQTLEYSKKIIKESKDRQELFRQ